MVFYVRNIREEFKKIKKELLNLKLMIQKVQIKKYSGVASLSPSHEEKIAAEIQLIKRHIGEVISKLRPQDKRERGELISIRGALIKMLETDEVNFSLANALPEKIKVRL